MTEFWAAILGVVASTVRVSTPLVFAALGGFMSERSGIVNIALEGKMLVGAFTAAVVTYYVGSPELGWVCGASAGVLLAALYGLFTISFRSDQIVAGTAINLFAMGLTPFLTKLLFGVNGSTPAIPLEARFSWEPMFLVVAVVIVVWAWSRWTPSGLWHQIAGEHPLALETAGVRVTRVRWFAVLCAGAFAGMGGATLSIALSSSFTRGMTAGRGFMALAALIFGKWRPIPTALACLLFGLADAMQIRLQGVILWGSDPVPVQFIQILPYVVTVVILAGWVGRARAPKALGIPFNPT